MLSNNMCPRVPAAGIFDTAVGSRVNVLSDSDQEEVNIQDVRQAQKLAGSLIWLATRTRPDISYAQSAVSSLAARDPSRALMLGKRVLRYLAGTTDVGLEFRPEGADFTAYCDASFEAHRSTTGSVVTYCGCVLAWRSAKQPQVAKSTADSEVTALAATASMAKKCACPTRKYVHPCA